jgi:predicted membrane-bound spermidine synthase
MCFSSWQFLGDLWYSLWQPVFNPALGILMGGAILSGIVNQVSKRLNPK